MSKEKLNTGRGGARKGSGPKKPEKTKVLYRRVPEGIYDEVAAYVDRRVAERIAALLKLEK